MTVKQIEFVARNAAFVAAVRGVTDRQELHAMFDVLKQRSRELDAVAGARFVPGQRVWFEGRRGQAVVGSVVSVHGRSVKVLAEDGVRWRVSPSSLSPVSADGRLMSGLV